MALHDLALADPPVGSQITLQVTLTNTGTVEGTFFVHAITSIVEAGGPNFGNIAGGNNFQGLNAITETFDNITTVATRSGDIGIITLPGESEIDLQFITPPMEVVGVYDIGIQAGIFDPQANEIIEVQDTIIAEQVFSIFEPANAQLSNIAVV